MCVGLQRLLASYLLCLSSLPFSFPPNGEIEMTKTEELLKLAEAATPGPWWHGEQHHPDGHALAWIGKSFVDCDGGTKNYREQKDDAAFIAAANPATIKALVELVRLQHGALELEKRTYHIKGLNSPTLEAIAAFEEFNRCPT